MEEITNLIENARASIENLESYLFNHKREKYLVAKSVTDYLKSEIEGFEALGKVDSSEEFINDTRSELSNIISKINAYNTAFQNGDEITINIDDFLGEDDDDEENLLEDPNPTIENQTNEFPQIVEGPQINTEQLATPISEEVPQMPNILDDSAFQGIDTNGIDNFLNNNQNPTDNFRIEN